MSNIIHGFDPGVSTGYINYDREKKKIISHKILKSYIEIFNILQCSKSDIVIYETNVGKSITSTQNIMINKVGFIQGLCECFNIEHYAQTPSVRKGYLNIAKNYLHNNCKNYECHNVDAFSHIVRWLSKNNEW